jgi:broad specificity polyphosphatase/5'/3'-nucleotidase SurE
MTNFTAAAKFTSKIVAKIKEQGLPKNILLSINIPSGEIKGVTGAPMALEERRRIPRAAPLESESGELTFTFPIRRNRPTQETRTDRPARPEGRARRGRRRGQQASPQPANTDEYYYRGKQMITITPLRLDWTDYGMISELKLWNLDQIHTNPDRETK